MIKTILACLKSIQNLSDCRSAWCRVRRRTCSICVIVARNWPLHLGSSAHLPGSTLYHKESVGMWWLPHCQQVHFKDSQESNTDEELISSLWGWYLFMQKFLVMLAVVLSLIYVFFPHGLYNLVPSLGFDCWACFYSTMNIQKHSKHASDGESFLAAFHHFC